MSNIINKSHHPVEIKKINIRVWKLRNEIEYVFKQDIYDIPALEAKLKKQGIEIFIIWEKDDPRDTY